jgi:hypothetical protein
MSFIIECWVKTFRLTHQQLPPCVSISKAASRLYKLVQACTRSKKPKKPESDKLDQLGLFPSQVVFFEALFLLDKL